LKKPMSRNFMESLVAVLGGNIVYFLLMPRLPEGARHTPQSIDLGLLVDFGFCAIVLGCVRALSRRIFKT
jgi:hypothetical protein